MAREHIRQVGDFRITTIVTGDTWRENAYVVRHVSSNEQLVIDPGSDFEAILDVARDQEGTIGSILLTHAHHDHVGAAAQMSRTFDLSCRVHVADQRLLRQASLYALRFAGRTLEVPTRVETFEGESAFTMAEGVTFWALPTPGHTAGSVCYLFDDFAFTGDTLFYEHVGRTDLPGGSAEQLGQSVESLLARLAPQAILFPGHGKTWVAAEAQTWWTKVSTSAPAFDRFGAL